MVEPPAYLRHVRVAGDIDAAGVTPFAGRAVFELAVAHMEEEPPDPRLRRDTVSEELAWSLLRALAMDPTERPPTALAYANLLSVATPR